MCGFLALQDRSKKLENFEEYLSLQNYRGPDASKAVEIKNGLFFGFNRLTINDLSEKSMQPFEYTGNHLLFNGEIYNWIELREYLEKKHSVEFTTTGDTEVLIVGLSLEGPEFLKKINGIFAICFYNNKKDEIIIARDHVGIKPLFYYHKDDKLIVTSDINSLKGTVGLRIKRSSINRHVFLDWFSAHESNESFFEDIHAVSPGTYITFSSTCVQEQKYYDINFTDKEISLEEAENKFDTIIHKVIDLESQADVKIGILLSGGIDSSTIAAIAPEYLLKKQGEVEFFTFYFSDKGESTDLEYAEQVVEDISKKYGNHFKLHAFNLDMKLTEEDFREAVISRGTPVFDVRQILMLQLYKKIHEAGFKVVLNGQGSDEIMYGYYPLDYWISWFYRNEVFTPDSIFQYYKEKNNKLKYQYLSTDFLEKAALDSKTLLDKQFEGIGENLPKEKRITDFFINSILPSLLYYEDKASMYSSIEVRVPFLNKLIVDFASQLPFTHHIHSNTSGRHFLRKSMEGIIRPSIIDRSKSPTPKKKHYFDELFAIYTKNREDILKSPLLKEIYNQELILDPQIINSQREYGYYGNPDDVFLEFLGVFFFEQEYLK